MNIFKPDYDPRLVSEELRLRASRCARKSVQVTRPLNFFILITTVLLVVLMGLFMVGIHFHFPNELFSVIIQVFIAFMIFASVTIVFLVWLPVYGRNRKKFVIEAIDEDIKVLQQDIDFLEGDSESQKPVRVFFKDLNHRLQQQWLLKMFMIMGSCDEDQYWHDYIKLSQSDQYDPDSIPDAFFRENAGSISVMLARWSRARIQGLKYLKSKL